MINAQVAVTTSATRLTPDTGYSGTLVIKNTGATGNVYVGGSVSVSSTNGYKLQPTEAVTLYGLRGVVVWAIGDAAATVTILGS